MLSSRLRSTSSASIPISVGMGPSAAAHFIFVLQVRATASTNARTRFRKTQPPCTTPVCLSQGTRKYRTPKNTSPKKKIARAETVPEEMKDFQADEHAEAGRNSACNTHTHTHTHTHANIAHQRVQHTASISSPPTTHSVTDSSSGPVATHLILNSLLSSVRDHRRVQKLRTWQHAVVKAQLVDVAARVAVHAVPGVQRPVRSPNCALLPPRP
jgi:hypothetical protein